MRSNQWNDGFSEGILNALALCVAHGDLGSTYYEEILSIGGEEKIIAYARRQGAMRWSGLDRHLRRKKQTERLLAAPTLAGKEG